MKKNDCFIFCLWVVCTIVISSCNVRSVSSTDLMNEKIEFTKCFDENEEIAFAIVEEPSKNNWSSSEYVKRLNGENLVSSKYTSGSYVIRVNVIVRKDASVCISEIRGDLGILKKSEPFISIMEEGTWTTAKQRNSKVIYKQHLKIHVENGKFIKITDAGDYII